MSQNFVEAHDIFDTLKNVLDEKNHNYRFVLFIFYFLY